MTDFWWWVIFFGGYLSIAGVFIYVFEFKIDYGSDPIAKGIIAAGRALAELNKKKRSPITPVTPAGRKEEDARPRWIPDRRRVEGDSNLGLERY